MYMQTKRVFLLDKPHVHFIAHHRHNDAQLLRTHLHATNLSRSISLQRLAIRTSGAVNSRSTLPLTVHTTIEHLPATSTPNLKHLLQRAWISVTVWKQKRDKELKLTQTQHQRSLWKRGPAPSRWDSRSSTIDPANGQENHCRFQTIISTEMNHVRLRTRQLDDTFHIQTNSDLPCDYHTKDSDPSTISKDVKSLRTLPKWSASARIEQAKNRELLHDPYTGN